MEGLLILFYIKQIEEKPLREEMALKEQITLSEIQPWLEVPLRDYEGLKLRRKANIVVVFVSGPKCRGPIMQLCTLNTEFLALNFGS